MTNLLKFTMILCLIYPLGCVVAGASVGKEFSPSTFNAYLGKMAASFGNTIKRSQTPEENPKPYSKVLADTLDGFNQGQPGAIESTGTPTPQIDSTPSQATDPRLTFCPAEAIDPSNLSEVDAGVARQLMTVAQVDTFAQIQQAFSVNGPACNIRDGESVEWFFLVQGDRYLKATQENPKSRVTITGTVQ